MLHSSTQRPRRAKTSRHGSSRRVNRFSVHPDATSKYPPATSIESRPPPLPPRPPPIAHRTRLSRVHVRCNMASFFDLKARKAAAASNGTADQKVQRQVDARNQPWVEK